MLLKLTEVSLCLIKIRIDVNSLKQETIVSENLKKRSRIYSYCVFCLIQQVLFWELRKQSIKQIRLPNPKKHWYICAVDHKNRNSNKSLIEKNLATLSYEDKNLSPPTINILRT